MQDVVFYWLTHSFKKFFYHERQHIKLNLGINLFRRFPVMFCLFVIIPENVQFSYICRNHARSFAMQLIFPSFAKQHCSDSNRELVFLVILLSIISCITCDDVHAFPVFMRVICLWDNSASSVIAVDCSYKATLGCKTPDTVISHSLFLGENKSALNAKAHRCRRNCKQYFYVSHFA